VPSPLVCIVAVTLVGHWLGLPLKTVADLGQLPGALPAFALARGAAHARDAALIALPAFAIAMVGLLESMMTASVVDELTDTPSSKNRECSGLGIWPTSRPVSSAASRAAE
jgi:SulP family sulfate permease